MTTTQLASDPISQALCPLSLQMRRTVGSVVGRPLELAAIESEIATARTTFASVTLEGEPGIGKTRVLVSAAQLAEELGFLAITVAADEELRGPFLVMRSVLASAAASGLISATGAEATVHRALDGMSGRDDPALDALPPDAKLLRQFDLAAVALSELAAERPVAILLDDLQWADEDSLRALRYVVRTDASSPIFLMVALRPEETAFVNEAVTFIADMERMGLVRRLKLGRFTQIETADYLRQLLGAEIHLPSAAAVHAQSEGVPFIIEEVARAYRETGMLQQIDGVWTLARNAERLVPSAVQTLISRRSGRLPEETKVPLAEAAVLGKSFSLRDLLAVRGMEGQEDLDPSALAEALAPAVAAGLLHQHPIGAPADYSFTHEHVREFALSGMSAPRRRAIHAAVVRMLTEGGDPSPESFGLLAQHAAAAGDAERCVRFSVSSARAALAANAPEEVLRGIEAALPLASRPQDRVDLLGLRDDALDMLRRPADRLEGLAELTALADALGDPHVALDVMLRRAAALRLAEEVDAAAEVAREVRARAEEQGDRRAELAACLELGQDCLRAALGEAYGPSARETDLDGAEGAFSRAADLAGELGDDAALAAGHRELGVIHVGRMRAWFVQRVEAGEHWAYMARVAAGETLDQILPELPIAPNAFAAQEHFKHAIELFEKVGDRRGVMSSVIAMAYLSYGPEIHMGGNPAKRIEEIRQLASRMTSLSKESERAMAEVQMLFGVHVFARAKMIPDLALSRGQDAYRAAVAMGHRLLQLSSAAGVAMAHLDLGEVEDAERWIDLAAAAAAAEPTPLRGRRVEILRGLARSRAGDASGMREHLDRALRSASEQGRAAARCELLAMLALEASRLGEEGNDDGLLSLAERTAREANELVRVLPAHPPWGPQADAALARVALARGDVPAAVEAARSAAAGLQSAMREDVYPEILIPVARALLAGGGGEELRFAQDHIRLMLAMTALRTLDESVRVRWFQGPVGRELVELVGPVQGVHRDGSDGDGRDASRLGADDARMLALLTEGLTNREIAERLGIPLETVGLRLQETFARIGASSRGEATAFALVEGVLK